MCITDPAVRNPAEIPHCNPSGTEAHPIQTPTCSYTPDKTNLGQVICLQICKHVLAYQLISSLK